MGGHEKDCHCSPLSLEGAWAQQPFVPWGDIAPLAWRPRLTAHPWGSISAVSPAASVAESTVGRSTASSAAHGPWAGVGAASCAAGAPEPGWAAGI